MADFPTYELSDVALVTGNDAAEYTNPAFVPESLLQATLLFKLGTCLKSNFPDDADDAAVARYGILFMADAIYWAQPWQKILRTPFSSETIGSYSYSKLSVADSAGLPTGVSWFDAAISKLSICDFNAGSVSGGINVFEENKFPHDGYGVFVGPEDENRWQPPFVPGGFEV